MLNPFILNPDRKWEKGPRPMTEKRVAQIHGTLVMHPAGQNRLTLRLGKLLIRMGKELTGEAAFQKNSMEPWLRCNQANARPVHFHHA
jgi:hypothetical protein